MCKTSAALNLDHALALDWVSGVFSLTLESGDHARL